MLSDEEIQRRINIKKEKYLAKAAKRDIRLEAFRFQICPDCGSDNVRTSVSLFSATEKYYCCDCKASMYNTEGY